MTQPQEMHLRAEHSSRPGSSVELLAQDLLRVGRQSEVHAVATEDDLR
jgi:hypothetical protein